MAKQQSATRTKGALNPRQLRFVDEYMVDMNATQAAIRSGYSKRSASEQGYDLLRHPQIALAIEAKRKELAHKAGVTVERVLSELSRIAFSDVRRLYHEDGRIKAPHEWDDDMARALSGVETIEAGDSGATLKKVRLWDKRGALEALLKHLGADADRAPREAEARPVVIDLDQIFARLKAA